MVYCCVMGCSNNTKMVGKTVSYFRFPGSPRLRNSWKKAVNLESGTAIENLRVCSDHFSTENLIKKGERNILRSTAIPALKVVKNVENMTISTGVSGVSRIIRSTSPVAGSSKDNFSTIPDRITPSNVFKRKTSESSTPSSMSSSGKRRMIKFFHNYSQSPEHYKVDLQKKRRTITSFKGKYYAAKKTSMRRRKKIDSLKQIVIAIRKKYALSTDALSVLESTFSGIPLALMKRMIRNTAAKSGKGKQKYSQEIKSFAMTLQFYSSKAYEYVRKTFDLALPAPSTLRLWMSKIDCSPGFTKPALDALKVRVDEFLLKQQQQLIACLMLDEMALKKEIKAERHSQNIWGYVDVGSNVEINNDREEATQALVLMVVGINDNFKIPIAYFFINKMNGIEKANIVKETLKQLHYTGVKIVALTCDGPQVHFKMMKELGCEISDLKNLKTYFEHPINQQKIYVIFDVCHMIKLIRNNWASSNILLDPQGNQIKWNYIEMLHKLQHDEGFNIANRLKKKHIEWRKAIMKVNIAAQTLSNSVSDALEFLQKDLHHKDFEDVGATVTFIRHFNDIFDILNSRNPFGRYMSTPMRMANESFWRPKMENILLYIEHIRQVDGTPLYMSRKKVPFLGFLISSRSLLAIYDEEVKINETLKYLLTYRFSQDHLELFFCCVRCRNGSNNNPSCLQFFHTYRRMLMHIDVKNNTGNCLPQDNTENLYVEPQITDITKNRIREDVDNLEEKMQCFLPNHFNEFSDNVIAYIAGFVIRSVKKKISCDVCVESLSSHNDEEECFKLINRKSKGGLLLPSLSVRKLCKRTENKIQTIYKILNALPPRDILITLLMKQANVHLTDRNIFSSLENHVFDTAVYETHHKKKLIESVIKTYANIRINSLANKINENISGEKVRKTLSKLILFRHQ